MGGLNKFHASKRGSLFERGGGGGLNRGFRVSKDIVQHGFDQKMVKILGTLPPRTYSCHSPSDSIACEKQAFSNV